MTLDTAVTSATTIGVPTALSIPGYVLVPTGARMFYVRSTGPQSFDPPALNNIITTVNAALALCRANMGDTVYVLPGHVETLTASGAWSNLVNGVRIVGGGSGTERPTFTLTGSNSSGNLQINKNNVVLDNLVFQNGGSDCTLAFDFSGANVTVQNCYVQASDASNKLTTVMRLSTGANDFHCFNTQIIGGATAITDTCLINAAVTRAVFDKCYFAASLGTTEGLITNATAATTRILIKDCVFENNVASSTVALKFTGTPTGTLFKNALGITVADGAGVGVAALNTPGSLRVNETYTCTVGKASVLSAAATTA